MWGGDRTMELCNRFIAVHALGFTFYNMVHLTNWIVNGMPERYPKLKVIWIESGLAWLMFLIQRLDNEYMMRQLRGAAPQDASRASTSATCISPRSRWRWSTTARRSS